MAGQIKYPYRETITNNNTLGIILKQGLFVITDASNDKAYIFSYDGTTYKSIMDNLTNPAYNKYSGSGHLYIENHTGSPVEFHVYSLV